jgi:hypothetical protein
MHLCKLEAASQDMAEAPLYNSSDGLSNEYSVTANGIYSSAELSIRCRRRRMSTFFWPFT